LRGKRENVFVEEKLADQELANSRLAGQKVPENRHGDPQLNGKEITERNYKCAIFSPCRRQARMPGE
jgi:hypothetical protein